MMIPTRATASGAPLITRALATARSIIRAKKPCSMSDTAPMIDMTESWLTRKQVEARLRPKYRYSLCDPRSPGDHQAENVRIGRLAWTSCDERVGFVRHADTGLGITSTRQWRIRIMLKPEREPVSYCAAMSAWFERARSDGQSGTLQSHSGEGDHDRDPQNHHHP